MVLTSEQCEARAKAYFEAAAHLEAGWTHDSVEQVEGRVIARSLRDAGEHWTKMANSRRNRNVTRNAGV